MVRFDSPNGSIVVEGSFRGDTQTLTVLRNGRTVIEPSPMGLTAPLNEDSPPEITDVTSEERSIENSFETTYGKRREHEHVATEVTITCEVTTGDVIELDLTLTEEGVAYRSRIPESGSTLLFEDHAAVKLPESTTAWLTPWAENHEAMSRRVSVAHADGEFCTPGLFEVREDDWVLLGEAGVDGEYHAARFRTVGDPRSTLLEYTHPWTPVRAKGQFETPWRVAIVGDLATVVESDLVPALVDEHQVADTEWIEPGRVAWSWWSETQSPTDPDRQREYVEYAADRGWEYVLIDEGWEPEWVPDIVKYAHDRDVGVFIWAHWSDLHPADERREKLDRWTEWDVDGIKVDFMDSDEQGRLQFYDMLMADTAERELLVNFHGSVVPTGLRRRWPHVLTYEGVLGAEHLKFGTITPEHNVTLPFTRNVVGPMDYTPVTFSAETRHTTVGHELALSVVYESGLQHFADSIDSYAEQPIAERFLERIPAAWDETRLLRGYPGSEATFARRRNDEWFIGCITAGAPRTVTLPLDFLNDAFDVTLVQDDEAGEELIRENVTGEPPTELLIDVPANGGFVLHCR